MLVVRNVHKVYEDGTHAVRGVSFSVRPGEIYGLIGPNGAGKTTTLRMIAGLIRPSSGEIYVSGVSVVERPLEARKYISYLPEEAEVYGRLTGLEHIEFYAKLYGVEGSVKNLEETVDYGVKLSGLGDRIRDLADGYSKGMKRRLLLAIVLMRKPRLAILDEPTSGLDVHAAVRVRDVIKKYVKETSSSVVVSSHNMLEVEYLCDRVGIMHGGRILVEDAPSKILEKYGVNNLEEAFVKIVEGV